MAARATGSGVISFGMVSIPIKLYSTVDSTKAIRFNFLRKDGTRLKQQYVSAVDGEVVPNNERIRGYEFAKDQYVLFTDDEMKAMDVKSTGEIEITEFVPAEQISALFIEKVNYLGPDKGASRPYRLLAEAMRTTGRSALAKYAARGKCYLVLIHPHDQGLIMMQLRHQEEMRPFDAVEIPDAEIRDDELALAIQLIDQVSSDEFHPENYRDEVRHHMLELIDQKVEGQEIVVAPQEEAETKIIDIMEALKASLKSSGSRKKAKAAPKRKAAAKPKAKQKAATGTGAGKTKSGKTSAASKGTSRSRKAS